MICDMVKKIFNRKNRLTAGLLGLIVILLGYVFALQPLCTQWYGLSKRVVAQQKNYMRQQTLVKNRDAYEKQFAPYAHALYAQGGHTQEENNAAFLKEIEAAIRTAGISIGDMRILPKVQEDGVTQYMIEVKMDALMDVFVTFLHTLALSDAFITVEELRIERKDAYTQTLTISAVFAKVTL